MTTKLIIDDKQGVAFIKRTGRIKPGELIQGTDKLLSNPSFKNITKTFGDLSTADYSDISRHEFEAHAVYCRDKFKNLTNAIIAPTDLIFGLTRRFATLSELKDLFITRDMNKALSWLKVTLPEEF